ncbi:MAG: hypothetical protein D6754_13100 [Alphaproteobacteria bacterium]|nr:MAG: hypothetical protein D6754_13100 [Alphaproteobacteria bacterium]
MPRPDQEKTIAYLREGVGALSGCIDSFLARVKALEERGEEPDWDTVNRELQRIIDAYGGEVKRLTGPDGVLETAQLLVASLDAERKNAERLFPDEKEREARLAEIESLKSRMTEAIDTVDTTATTINQLLREFLKMRPRIAFDIRLQRLNQAVGDLEQIAAQTRDLVPALEAAQKTQTTPATGD